MSAWLPATEWSFHGSFPCKCALSPGTATQSVLWSIQNLSLCDKIRSRRNVGPALTASAPCRLVQCDFRHLTTVGLVAPHQRLLLLAGQLHRIKSKATDSNPGLWSQRRTSISTYQVHTENRLIHAKRSTGGLAASGSRRVESSTFKAQTVPVESQL